MIKKNYELDLKVYSSHKTNSSVPWRTKYSMEKLKFFVASEDIVSHITKPPKSESTYLHEEENNCINYSISGGKFCFYLVYLCILRTYLFGVQ